MSGPQLITHSRRNVIAVIALAAGLAACNPFGPTLISSSTVNGKKINVFASGSAPRNSDVEQNGTATRLKLGTRVVVVNLDGRVSVDGVETAYGPFTEINVTLGDNNTIEVKVVK